MERHVLGELTLRRDELGPAETRLADCISRSGSAVAQWTLNELARRAEVSEPTVLRLLRKLGCRGFSDFRIRLAQELASGPTYLHRDIEFGDSTQALCEKVINSGIANLARVRDALDIATIERAIEALARAHRIDFFATGQTAIVALDAQQKFQFLEVPAIYQFDVQLQTMSAAVLRSTDVAVCFSFTGQKIDIVRCAEAARSAGATVITVTRTGSPLSKLASIAVAIDVPETTSVYSPVDTRMAHLAVVDIFATGVALRRGPGITDRIRTMKEVVARKIVPSAKDGDSAQ
jgi:RpiR family transcriptional regulator, carbohydrate utilization regulator